MKITKNQKIIGGVVIGIAVIGIAAYFLYFKNKNKQQVAAPKQVAAPSEPLKDEEKQAFAELVGWYLWEGGGKMTDKKEAIKAVLMSLRTSPIEYWKTNVKALVNVANQSRTSINYYNKLGKFYTENPDTIELFGEGF